MQQFPSVEQPEEESWLDVMLSQTNGGVTPNHNGINNGYIVSNGSRDIYKSTLSGTPIAILSWEEATKLAELIISMGDKAIVFRLETI